MFTDQLKHPGLRNIKADANSAVSAKTIVTNDDNYCKAQNNNFLRPSKSSVVLRF